MPSIARRITVATLSLGALAGCSYSSAEQYDPSVWTWKGELKSGTIHIRDLNGSVEVKPATDANVSVVASARWHRGNPKNDVKYQVASSGSDVTICALWDEGTCSPTGSYTTHGNFLSKLLRKKNDVAVSFTVLVPTGVQVDVLTVNGGISVFATAPVKARSVNGGIKVATAVGPVDAETVNGSVDARMTTLSGDGPIRAKTVNGTARLYVPQTLDGDVSIETMNGSLVSDFALAGAEGNTRRHLRGTVGKGGRRVEAFSLNGGSAVHMLNADGTVATPGAPVAAPAVKP
jgi:DUF4097 and DUF4098 domain-containing protein YvlB